MSYMNQVYGLARHQSLVAQWLEHPTGVGKIIGSHLVGDLDIFFFVPRLRFDKGYRNVIKNVVVVHRGL